VRVLLDEQLPRHLARELRGHEVSTVQQKGWAGLKNGELLRRAADAGFEVFLTADRNLEFQQNLSQTRLRVILLVAPSNTLEDLLPLCTRVAGRNFQEPARQDTTCRGITSKSSTRCHFDVSRILETWKFRKKRRRSVYK